MTDLGPASILANGELYVFRLEIPEYTVNFLEGNVVLFNAATCSCLKKFRIALYRSKAAKVFVTTCLVKTLREGPIPTEKLVIAITDVNNGDLTDVGGC